MGYSKFVAFYNAYTAEYTKPLIAFGWTSEGGWTPVLSGDGSQYELKFEDNGGPHTEPVTPFIISMEMDNPPRSIDVTDEHGTHHIQVYGLPDPSTGENEGGAPEKSE